MYECAQKNERLTFHENFPFGPFPRFPHCGNFFFIALSLCAEFYFFYGH